MREEILSDVKDYILPDDGHYPCADVAEDGAQHCKEQQRQRQQDKLAQSALGDGNVQSVLGYQRSQQTRYGGGDADDKRDDHFFAVFFDIDEGAFQMTEIKGGLKLFVNIVFVSCHYTLTSLSAAQLMPHWSSYICL